MHHLHIDRYAGFSTPVHRIDPRAKLLTLLSFIVLVVVTPDGFFVSFAAYLAFVWAVILFAKLPVIYVLKRSLLAIPFSIAVAFFVPFITPGPEIAHFQIGALGFGITSTGIVKFVSMCLRVFISFFAVILLVSSTPFGDLMWAAGKIGLPSRLVVIISFMYRYIFILVDEASHMLLARDLRNPLGKRTSLIKAAGGIIGSLFIRSFEHAETLYSAMLLRGYSGRPVSLFRNKILPRDIQLSGAFIITAVFALFIGSRFHA